MESNNGMLQNIGIYRFDLSAPNKFLITLFGRE